MSTNQSDPNSPSPVTAAPVWATWAVVVGAALLFLIHGTIVVASRVSISPWLASAIAADSSEAADVYRAQHGKATRTHHSDMWNAQHNVNQGGPLTPEQIQARKNIDQGSPGRIDGPVAQYQGSVAMPPPRMATSFMVQQPGFQYRQSVGPEYANPYRPSYSPSSGGWGTGGSPSKCLVSDPPDFPIPGLLRLPPTYPSASPNFGSSGTFGGTYARTPFGGIEQSFRSSFSQLGHQRKILVVENFSSPSGTMRRRRPTSTVESITVLPRAYLGHRLPITTVERTSVRPPA